MDRIQPNTFYEHTDYLHRNQLLQNRLVRCPVPRLIPVSLFVAYFFVNGTYIFERYHNCLDNCIRYGVFYRREPLCDVVFSNEEYLLPTIPKLCLYKDQECLDD